MALINGTQVVACSERMTNQVTMTWRRSGRPIGAHCNAVVKAQATSGVRIDVEKTSWNSRSVFAAVTVSAPKRSVWSALTDYNNLHTFIPSLVENRCLERDGTSVLLYQVGAQDVALGVKFSAAMTLRCTEFEDGGLPENLMTPSPFGNGSSNSSGDWGSESGTVGPGSVDKFPFPSTSAPGVLASDISFEEVEGDFQAFRGLWRMQQTGEQSTLLSYALYVRPQAWLPVGLVQGRIEGEVQRNLEAVSRYAESQFQLEQQGQEQPVLQG